MIAKATLAILIAAASAYGGTQLIDAIKPIAEDTTARSTIRTVLDYAQVLENLNGDQAAALQQAVRETPDATGMTTDGKYIYYSVIDTCLKGSLGEYDKKIIETC